MAPRFSAHTLILLLVLVAFALRLYRLDGQALRGDEAATILYSAMPLEELWELARVTDPHPPLYYALLHPWQRALGESAWMMRFVGAAASTLAVVVLYGLARCTLLSRGLSLLSAGLLAINPLQIWLAQDVRSYPIVTLVGLLSSWALWAALGEPGSREAEHLFINKDNKNQSASLAGGRRWLLYVALTVACFYIHYYTIFLIAFQGLFVVIYGGRFWDKKWGWLAAQVTVGLLLIPGLLLAYNFVGQAAGGIETLPMLALVRLASTALLTGFTLPETYGTWLSLLLAPVWLVGLVSLLRRGGVAGTFWVLFFVVPVAGVIALSWGRPFFKERFLVQAQPAFELLLAAGLVALANRHRWRGDLVLLLPLLVVNVLALRNYYADPAYTKAPPWHFYHDYVEENARPGDVMLTNFPEAAVSYYSPNRLPFYVVPAERDRPPEFRLEQTAQIAGAYRRVWFLPMLQQGFDENGEVLNWLDRHADRVNQIFFPAYNLNLYLTPPEIEALLIPQPALFAHGIHLRGYQILNEQGDSRLTSDRLLALEPEEEFTLSLYWRADGPTPIPYTVFTHLIAADGYNLVGQDNQPVWGNYPTTAWPPDEKVTDRYTLSVPAGTLPGDYRLRVGWYDPTTLERVLLRGAGDDHIILRAIIRVE
jgi:hypothetical protein